MFSRFPKWECSDFGGYDTIGDINTAGFTQNLDKLTFLDEHDPFIYFLRGFYHGELPCIILDGFRSENNINLFVEKRCQHNAPMSGIYIAWNKFLNIGAGTNATVRVRFYNEAYYCSSALVEDTNVDRNPATFYEWLTGRMYTQPIY